MKIYLIQSKDKFRGVENILGSYGDVVVLDSGEKDLNKYRELFDNDSEKVVGISPGVVEWKFPLEVIKKLKKLKGICTKSSWAYYIDIDYCKKSGIIVCNTPGANSQSVAEYAIWQALSLARKFPLQLNDKFLTKHDNDHLQTEIMGKTAGIVGLGNVGSRIASLTSGLGMKVIYWNRSKKRIAYKRLTVDKLLKTADFIFNCLEICEGTYGFFDKKRLCSLRKDSYFISVIGGGGWKVEDTDYLIKMVEKGRLAGYSVENEHAEGYKLPKDIRGNVFIPGAYAWYTKEARKRSNQMWVDSIIGVVKGKQVYVVT